MRQAWEYARVPYPMTRTTEELNKLGGQGWELVAIENGAEGTHQIKEYIFKRPLEYTGPRSDAGAPVLAMKARV